MRTHLTRTASVLETAFERLAPVLYKRLALADTSTRIEQMLLAQRYRDAALAEGRLPALRDAEFRAFSQNGEDGILLYIFALLGAPTRTCVEICAADGIECNTANLILTHGWHGLLVDGSAANIRRGQAFYRRYLGAPACLPTFRQAWVTTESVNEIITDAGFKGEIDLLSLDLDGVDYWIWKAIDVIQPRVVVLEYNASLGPVDCLSVPYRPDFAEYVREEVNYWGASLPAFVKLATAKGYRLVGAESMCRNAFFVRNGPFEDVLPEVSAATCFGHPRLATLKSPKTDRPWVRTDL
jgi:hypothetical protein